jgi:hypothetical protein
VSSQFAVQDKTVQEDAKSRLQKQGKVGWLIDGG